MFVIDIETLDKFDSSVILSLGAVWFDPATEFDVEQLRKQSFFVKFNAAEQVKRKRTISEDTLKWWQGQEPFAKAASFTPKPDDLPLAEGMAKFDAWYVSNLKTKDEIVFARGSLDYTALEHAAIHWPFKLSINYWQMRDVRTAVDLLSGSTRGYCEVSKPLNDLCKHHPVDDCIIDAMMLKYFVPTA